MFEEKEKQVKTNEDFEARQNAAGLFGVMLGVVLRNPELRKKIFEENNKKENNV